MKNAIRECANHEERGPGEIKHWCIPRDAVCKVLSGERCSYFEDYVLPDPLLADARREYEIMHKLCPTTSDILNRVHCALCNKIFLRRSNRQTLCPDCQKAHARDMARERKRKQRLNVTA